MQLQLGAFLFFLLSLSDGNVIVATRAPPDGPQGPDGAILKFDLLSNSEAGISYPGLHLGAFVPQTWSAGHVNHELQEYVPEAAAQDGDTNEITITAARLSLYKIYQLVKLKTFLLSPFGTFYIFPGTPAGGSPRPGWRRTASGPPRSRPTSRPGATWRCGRPCRSAARTEAASREPGRPYGCSATATAATGRTEGR